MSGGAIIATALVLLIFGFLLARLIAAILTNAERHNLSDELPHGDCFQATVLNQIHEAGVHHE